MSHAFRVVFAIMEIIFTAISIKKTAFTPAEWRSISGYPLRSCGQTLPPLPGKIRYVEIEYATVGRFSQLDFDDIDDFILLADNGLTDE